ncbi:MAG: hypothetical protein J6U23_11135 [Clostridiales bacterium]|nr:hypothetical protein [Clostridiales bacterium]
MKNEGQLSIFDIHNPQQRRRPCEYDFKRYLGQEVLFFLTGHKGKIVSIEPYYTIVDPGTGEGYLAGTPTTICPVNKEEEDG